MNIKDILLSGGLVKFSYKEDVKSWMGNSEIYFPFGGFGMRPKIIVTIPTHEIKGRKEFKPEEIDEAIETFTRLTFRKENLAYKMHEAMLQLDSDLDLDEDDDWNKMESVRLKLVNNE